MDGHLRASQSGQFCMNMHERRVPVGRGHVSQEMQLSCPGLSCSALLVWTVNLVDSHQHYIYDVQIKY